MLTEPVIEFIKLTGLALLGGSALVQIAPIKINPWTWLAKKIGRAINGEVIARVDILATTVKRNQETADARAAKDARIRILRFGDELLHDKRHSKEHFDQILQDITEYEQYCGEHPDFKNNMTKMTTRKILETYSEVWDQPSFQ